jgi:cyclase
MLRTPLYLLLLVLTTSVFPTYAQQDFSKVEIKASKVAGNVWMLEGSGGNIGVSVGNDGLLIVDDQYAPLADKIKAALAKLGAPESKLKFIINTHWHGDHTGGNAAFGAEAPIIAQTNVRKRLGASPDRPKAALPIITFDQSLSIHFNGEEIEAVHYPKGHTDGDGVIWFKGSNVVHLGDHMMTGRFPFVDVTSGGSVAGIIKNHAALIAKLPADIKIIPGHGAIATLDDLKALHQVLSESVEIVRKQVQAGKDLEAIKAAGLPESMKSWGSGFISTPVWIETVYKSLVTAKQ